MRPGIWSLTSPAAWRYRDTTGIQTLVRPCVLINRGVAALSLAIGQALGTGFWIITCYGDTVLVLLVLSFKGTVQRDFHSVL
jgi:hypothetical protein